MKKKEREKIRKKIFCQRYENPKKFIWKTEIRAKKFSFGRLWYRIDYRNRSAVQRCRVSFKYVLPTEWKAVKLSTECFWKVSNLFFLFSSWTGSSDSLCKMPTGKNVWSLEFFFFFDFLCLRRLFLPTISSFIIFFFLEPLILFYI